MPWLHTACGHCEHFITGWEILCESQQNTGYSIDGGFAEYVLADPHYVGRLPATLAFEPGAPILCAGVTVYKGLKEAEVRPGEWVMISGSGGLGHMAVQYANALGMHVAAVDIAKSKLDLARALGADLTINAAETDPGAEIHKAIGGAHGAFVTAVARTAFTQALRMVRRKSTISLNGLPPGDFPIPIFDVVLKRLTIRGSIVGTRKDLAEALMFAGEGKIAAHHTVEPLENVNDIFVRMHKGAIDGRIVMTV